MDNQTSIQDHPQLPERKKASFGWILGVLILALILFAIIFIFTDQTNTGTATLSWNVNTEADLAGYKIYYGTSPRTGDCPAGGYPEKIDVGKTTTPNNPSYTIDNLQNGDTYYFSITSYDTSGNESCFSDEMSKNIEKAKSL